MPRQVNVREKASSLKQFFRENKRVPGYAEMLKLFGYRSKNAVHGILRKFEQQGYISLDDGRIALTNRLIGGIRVLGSVQAGFPSPAEEELVDTLTLDELLIERPDATFMLKVSGDSMIDAGILPGDIVLVERGATPKNGDVIIAQVDGEWTMKFFQKDRTGVRLEPANRKYHTIRPEHSFEVGGVVRTVIRKFK